MFKYFNKMVEASEMMFIRTPSSIGRNVGNCHPPKSMRKVATLIRDLQIKRREYECMWFKKDGKYVHITYKGLFSKEGKFLGDRKSTRLNSSHVAISYAVFCLKKKKK